MSFSTATTSRPRSRSTRPSRRRRSFARATPRRSSTGSSGPCRGTGWPGHERARRGDRRAGARRPAAARRGHRARGGRRAGRALRRAGRDRGGGARQPGRGGTRRLRGRTGDAPLSVRPAEATYPARLQDRVDGYLEGLSFARETATEGLEKAMRYSLLAGGKRIRPVLALATAEAVGRDPDQVLPI